MNGKTLNGKTLALPLLSVAIGVAYLVAGLLGGQPEFAVTGAVVMFGTAALIMVVRRRSETLQGLMDRRDERINTLDLRATAVTGLVLVIAILTAFVVEIARGHTGAPYLWLGCLGGVTYIAALLYFRLRS